MLIGAYACGPDEGPESSAGWAFAVAAARDHDVWVVTRHRFRALVEEALAADPDLATRLTVEYLDLSPAVMAWKRRSWDLYWYYVLWQRALTRRARALHAQIGFDVTHHVSFANDWLPCGLGALDVPLVWGPVGGASRVPIWRLKRWLGVRGLATEVARKLLTGALRRVFADPVSRRAALVVGQNDAVARRFRRARRVVVEPNACLVPATGDRGPHGALSRETGRTATPTALFVGRLNAWKGGRLAVAAMAHPLATDWQLRIFGEGYERAALERMSHELGVTDRVHFEGHRPRDEVLAAYEQADVFLFPSLHDQAGWVVAEASSAGCPVVCLPLGGPPILAERNGHVASLEGDVVDNLARKLVEAGRSRGVPHERWSTARLPALVGGWYDDAIASGAGRVGREP